MTAARPTHLDPLAAIAADLGRESAELADCLISPRVEPVLGRLVAVTPRAQADPEAYAYVIEAIFEGYLLHHGRSRVLAGHDPDLGLLAGDLLYALGLDHLADLGDAPAVAQLGELISLASLCHREGLEASLWPLWLAATVAVGCGETPLHRQAYAALRALEPASKRQLSEAAKITAVDSGIEPGSLLYEKPIDFSAVEDSHLG